MYIWNDNNIMLWSNKRVFHLLPLVRPVQVSDPSFNFQIREESRGKTKNISAKHDFYRLFTILFSSLRVQVCSLKHLSAGWFKHLWNWNKRQNLWIQFTYMNIVIHLCSIYEEDLKRYIIVQKMSQKSSIQVINYLC